MKKSIHNYFLIIIVLSIGCDKEIDRKNNCNVYNKSGIEFKYPRNWKITDDIRESDYRQIILESPIDAILIIIIYFNDYGLDINEFAELFSKELNKEMTSDFKISSISFSEIYNSNGYDILTENIDIAFHNLNESNTRFYRRKAVDDKVCFTFTHVANTNLPKVLKGLEQIHSSLIFGTTL